jgi:hypothetical protein
MPTDIHLTPDSKAYAYSYTRTLSELYVIEGLRVNDAVEAGTAGLEVDPRQ